MSRCDLQLIGFPAESAGPGAFGIFLFCLPSVSCQAFCHDLFFIIVNAPIINCECVVKMQEYNVIAKSNNDIKLDICDGEEIDDFYKEHYVLIAPNSTVWDNEGKAFIVESEIGRGGFGLVFRIRAEKEQEEYFALKTLPSSYATTQDLFALENDAELAIKIDHSNVIKYYFFHDGKVHSDLPPYIIMEYAEGGSLRDYLNSTLEQKQEMKASDLSIMISQLVDGMEAINKLIVHRDLKPENILIADGTLKISDFGLSKIAGDATRTQTFKGEGTWPYMAPETWIEKKNTMQIDIYSLGVIFFEIATGRYPYNVESSNWEDWRNAHMYDQPVLPSNLNSNLSSHFDQVVLKMLSKDTHDRYNSWDDVRVGLKKGSKIGRPDNDRVGRILGKLAARDNEAKQRMHEQAMKERDKKEYRKRIENQFQNDIIAKLESFVKEIYGEMESGSLLCEPVNLIDDFSCAVRMERKELLTVWLKILHDDEYLHEWNIRDILGEIHTRSKFERPRLHDRTVMAWGGFFGGNKTGMNIILLESNDSVYGQWKSMKNTNSAGIRNPREPEPFVFSHSELREAITMFDVSHIYQSSILEFNVSQMFDLVEAGI